MPVPKNESTEDKYSTLRWVVGLAILGSVAGYAFGTRFLVKDASRMSKNFENQYHRLHPKGKEAVEEAEQAAQNIMEKEAPSIARAKEAGEDPAIQKTQQMADYAKKIKSRFPDVNNYVKNRSKEYREKTDKSAASPNE